MPDPNQNNQSQNSQAFPFGDAPPLPPDFQNEQIPPVMPTQTSQQSQPAQTGAPVNPPSDTPPIISPPKKKFGGGRVIATILGIFMLVGGIGAGIALTNQQQLFEQKASGLSTCGSGLNCSASNIGGASACNQNNGNPNAVFCCPAGQTIRNGSCSNDAVRCGDGQCETNEGNAQSTSYCPRDCSNTGPRCGDQACNGTETTASCPADCGSGTINCGGVQCRAEDCHCQGGDLCTSLKCEPGIAQSCRDQGRSMCSNHQTGGGMTCCEVGYVCFSGGEGCIPGGGGGTPRPSSPPSSNPPQITASCQNIKAYSTSFAPLSAAQLANIPVGGKVNFCVTGAATGGSFDKARFRVNGTSLGETTRQRPGSQDFCIEFTIPSGTTSFTVVGDIHHTTLGYK